MRHSTRSLTFLDASIGQWGSIEHVCRSCRHRAFRQRIVSQQQRRHASNQPLPFTEKLRRKIWGTENPPGLKDPYGGLGFLKRRRMTKNDEAIQDISNPEKDAPTRTRTKAEASKAAPVLILPTEPTEGREVLFEEDKSEAEEDPEYKPAETWNGLEHVGHKGHWSDIPPVRDDAFRPFLRFLQKKAASESDFLSAFHQATVEIMTLQRAGQDMNKATSTLAHNDVVLGLISETKIIVSNDTGKVNLEYPIGNAEAAILKAFENGGEPQDPYKTTTTEPRAHNENFEEEAFEATGTREDIDAEIAEQKQLETEITTRQTEENTRSNIVHPIPAPAFYRVQHKDFLALTLQSGSESSFALLKRITQLTGHRIPDPVISNAKTLRSILIHHLNSMKPKPKNLAEVLMKKETLASLPNVRILPRRETPIDKEKRVGRWKVIEEELRDRGLPVLGRPEA